MIDVKLFKTTSFMVKLGNAVTYYRNEQMNSIDLTSVQSDALIATLRNPGITASQMKEQLQLSQSTVAGIIARLENKELISKTTDEGDARKTILMPTEQGLLLAEPLKEIAVKTQKKLVEGMSEIEQQEFDRLLQIALNNLSRER